MKDRVKSIISEILNIPVDVIDDNSDIIEKYGADSLDAADLVLEFEKVFGFTVPDEDAVELRTVSKIVNYIQDNK